MTKSHSVDYADVLSDLKAKRKEIDKAIASFEALGNMGLFSGSEKIQVINPQIVDLRGQGTYEATAALLKINGKSMKTKDIFNTLLKHGVIDKGSKMATVAATLYKAVDKKADCKIKKFGKGEWTLS